MKKVEAVIFDYGNVLSEEQSPELIRQMADHLQTDVAHLEHWYWQHRGPYDCGEIGGREYWQRIAIDMKRPLTDADADQLIEVDNRSWSVPNKRIVRWSHALKERGLKISILSNMPVDFRLALHINCKFLPEFDQKTYSSELKMMKPDQRIYEYCLSGLNVDADACLFLDDRLPNIEAAQKLGIQTLHFLRTEDVLSELHAIFGWEPQPDTVKSP